jgi:hypothetical protein
VTATGPLPRPLRWAARLLVGEAVVVAIVVAVLAYRWLRVAGAEPVGTGGVIGYAAVMVAALAGVAAALARRKPRARAPAIVLQLLGVVVAYYFATAGLLWVSLLVAAVALLVITLLLMPATTAALTS